MSNTAMKMKGIFFKLKDLDERCTMAKLLKDQFNDLAATIKDKDERLRILQEIRQCHS